MRHYERRNKAITMRRKRKILLAIAIVFVAIQFIQSAHNTSTQVLPTDFVAIYKPPKDVEQILQIACYDCHSNNTRYPWYSNIQPMGWLLAHHIKNGKEELNFSEFGSYSTRRRISKLKAIADQIKDDEMPLTSYKMMHKDARLSAEEKNKLKNWASNKRDSLSANR